MHGSGYIKVQRYWVTALTFWGHVTSSPTTAKKSKPTSVAVAAAIGGPLKPSLYLASLLSVTNCVTTHWVLRRNFFPITEVERNNKKLLSVCSFARMAKKSINI